MIVCVLSFSLLCFASLVVAIVGFVRKNNKFIWGGVSGFFVFGLITFLLTVIPLIDFIGMLSADDVAETAGEVSERGGKIMGKVIKRTVSGMAVELESELVQTDSTIGQAGIVLNHCENQADSSLSMYLEFLKDFDGVLTLYAYDMNDKKQGIAKDTIHAKAGDEGVYLFDFKEGLNSGFSGHYRLVAK